VFASPGAFAFPAAQQTHTTTPCAMGFSRLSLPPGSEKTLYTVIGHAESLAQLNDTVIPSVGPSFFRDKLAETRRLTADVSAPIQTRTASPEFDRYCASTFLDNVLRGGPP
jgi:cellobiose phosphorylase